MTTITLKGVLLGPAPEIEVEADVFGVWAAHHAWSVNDEYSVSHVPIGGRVATVETAADAKRVAKALAASLPGLGADMPFGERPGAAWIAAVAKVLRAEGVVS